MTNMVRVGPILRDKSGPNRTPFAWVGILTNKIRPTGNGFNREKRFGGLVLVHKSSPGDQFCVGPFLP